MISGSSFVQDGGNEIKCHAHRSPVVTHSLANSLLAKSRSWFQGNSTILEESPARITPQLSNSYRD